MRVCKYCLLELVPGVGSESEHWRSKSGDGKLRYFCSISPDARNARLIGLRRFWVTG